GLQVLKQNCIREDVREARVIDWLVFDERSQACEEAMNHVEPPQPCYLAQDAARLTGQQPTNAPRRLGRRAAELCRPAWASPLSCRAPSGVNPRSTRSCSSAAEPRVRHWRQARPLSRRQG